jgi:antitoxin component YwqK of YwqJK toxin-antitoxin module
MTILFLESGTVTLAAEDWYLSNAAGLALQPIPRVRALREEYSLSVDSVDPAALSAELSSRAVSSTESPSALRAESRVLYRQGKQKTNTVYLYDSKERLRGVERKDDQGDRIIETYDLQGVLIRESLRAADGSGTDRTFRVRAGLPQESETFFVAHSKDGASSDPQLFYKELYRYDRGGSLRSIERILPSGGPVTIRLPRLAEPIPSYGFISPGTAGNKPNARVEFATDTRGRIVAERRYEIDDDGKGEEGAKAGDKAALVEETANVWSENRLLSTTIITPDGVFRTEYEYDPEDRLIMERNFKDSVLERTVRREGDRDIEELYLDGAPALRAVWVGTTKVSEELLLGRNKGTKDSAANKSAANKSAANKSAANKGGADGR